LPRFRRSPKNRRRRRKWLILPAQPAWWKEVVLYRCSHLTGDWPPSLKVVNRDYRACHAHFVLSNSAVYLALWF
jgi:hypothetical protein